MPYKHNFWATIVRKSHYYKAPLANFTALRPVADWVPVSVICRNPCLLAIIEEFSDARYGKYVVTTNYIIHLPIDFTVINNYLNTEGLHMFSRR